jgi:hydrogenase maturation protease
MLIIGYGNLDRGDDAAGLLVARRLRERGVPAILHSGDGLALLDMWEVADVVMIDAMAGAEEGSVRVFNADEIDGSAETFPSTHDFGLREAIALGRVLNRMPRRLTIYGIGGARFERGEGPSSEVLAAVERVVNELSARCLPERDSEYAGQTRRS